MRFEAAQGLIGLALVSGGAGVEFGWPAAVLVAGALVFIDYAAGAWRKRG